MVQKTFGNNHRPHHNFKNQRTQKPDKKRPSFVSEPKKNIKKKICDAQI